MINDNQDNNPTPDNAEYEAYFPSLFSLTQFVAPMSDLAGSAYPNPYDGKRKILVIGSDERYVPTENGKLFSTGNHPIETLVPLYHMVQAGFDFDVATVSGNMVKFEFWAMPQDDKAITGLYADNLAKFRSPMKLSDVVSKLGPNSDYAAVFIPGGHGALEVLPTSRDVADALDWALDNDRFIISLCHGPAALLASVQSGKHAKSPFDGYAINAFPDSADAQLPAIGYLPGKLTWSFGEKLKSQGLDILNGDITGATHKDRNLLTGDSPAAANALGKLAAEALLGVYVRDLADA